MPSKSMNQRREEHDTYSLDENGIPTFTYPWSRVKQVYRDWHEGNVRPIGQTARDHMPQWAAGGSFYGATAKEMLDWLSNGYKVEAASGLPAPRQPAPLPDWQFNDIDGEFDNDAWISGDPNYFLDSELQTIPQGVNLIVGMGFNAGTSSSLIAEYGKWIGSVVESLEQRGISLQVTIEYEGKNRYDNGRSGDIKGRVNHRVIVSRFGETNLDTDWSALFSPGAYRHLGWTTYCLPTEDGIATLRSGLGASTPAGFAVKWDADSRTIRTTVDCHASTFSAATMNRQYRDALDAATGS